MLSRKTFNSKEDLTEAEIKAANQKNIADLAKRNSRC
jgi:hypothetical protein